MDEELRIFISHKMPADTPLAQEIGSKLALYAGNRVKVTHAGKFRYGEDWRARIEDELNKAHWFILLYTEEDEDWSFCLYECGFFRHVMAGDERRRLITLCRKQSQISKALEDFNALVVSEEAVGKLLEDIYLKEWQVSPDLEPTYLKTTANDIVGVFTGSVPVEANFDFAPSLTIELTLSDAAESELEQNRMPADTVISGTKDWQQLFGREVDTGGWCWRELVADWAYGDIYEFLVARMIQDALASHMPRGIFLRSHNSGELYRVALRRYERVAGNKYRFHFTAAPLDLPFDLPIEQGQKGKETVLYHLLNLSWYFRRRLVDHLYERMRQLASMPHPDKVTLNETYDALGRELMQIAVQSIIRGIDNPLVIQDALGTDDPEAHRLLEQAATWQTLRDHIFRSMAERGKGLQSVTCDLYKMAMQNYDFYRIVAARYAAFAQELPPPPEPLGGCSQDPDMDVGPDRTS